MHFVELYENFRLTPPLPCFSEPERSLSLDNSVAPSFVESASDGIDFTLLREPKGAMKVECKTLPYQEQHDG
jgi:hypothetical protein